jgi:hypothetical protein
MTRRTYRLAPLDSTGWLYGLSGSQCISLVVGIFASGVALDSQLPAPLVVAPLVVALAFAFLQVGNRSALGLIDLLLRRLSLRLSKSSRWNTSSTALPPFLEHIDIHDFSTPQNGATNVIGIAIDRLSNTISTTILVSSPKFVLCERDDQARMLDA